LTRLQLDEIGRERQVQRQGAQRAEARAELSVELAQARILPAPVCRWLEVGWLVGRVLVCAFVCAIVSAFVCSLRGLFACVLSCLGRDFV